MRIICSTLLLFFIQTSYYASGQVKDSKNTIVADLKKLKSAIELNPENQKAHENYINESNIRDSSINRQYVLWMKKYPKSSIVYFKAAEVYRQQGKYDKARECLLKATSIKSNFDEAWYLLADDATYSGDTIKSQQYLQNAVISNPKNAKYSMYYALSFEHYDIGKCDSLLLDITRKYPSNEYGAQSLNYLAYKTTIVNEKMVYYDQLYKNYINIRSDAKEDGMISYYDILLTRIPEKALSLAIDMFLNITTVNRHIWSERIKIAKEFIGIRGFLANSQPLQAQLALNKISIKKYLNLNIKETLALLKAEVADANNQTQTAYDSLTYLYSRYPSDNLHAVIFNYAKKLGLDNKQINKDIQQLRDSTSQPATYFSLPCYATPEKASLSDYKGKVVLLTYWFPGCLPCREEFKYLESVIKKFNSNQIAYLAININNYQEQYIDSFLKSNDYSFIPLCDDPAWKKGNLSVIGVPANYLIDQKGRIIFSNFQINAQNKRMLELMISELLNVETY